MISEQTVNQAVGLTSYSINDKITTTGYNKFRTGPFRNIEENRIGIQNVKQTQILTARRFGRGIGGLWTGSIGDCRFGEAGKAEFPYHHGRRLHA